MKKHPNILVCGPHDSRKTHLIQTICHEGTVPDEAIRAKTRKAFESVVYQTEFANFINAPAIQLGDLPKEYWSKLQSRTKRYMPYDCVWHCIDGSTTTVQHGDFEILKLAGDKCIAVINNSESIDNEIQEEMLEELEKHIPAERIVTVSSAKQSGLSKLLDCSKNIIYGVPEEGEDEKKKLFEEWDNYFANQQEEWDKTTRKLAESYIYWGAGRALTVVAVPIPIVDVFPLVVNEAYMVYRIGACYGYAVDKSILAAFMGCIGGSIAGKLLATAIPFGKAPIAAAITYGVGRAAMAYFESDMKIGKKELKEIFKSGKLKGKKINWKTIGRN